MYRKIDDPALRNKRTGKVLKRNAHAGVPVCPDFNCADEPRNDNFYWQRVDGGNVFVGVECVPSRLAFEH